MAHPHRGGLSRWRGDSTVGWAGRISNTLGWQRVGHRAFPFPLFPLFVATALISTTGISLAQTLVLESYAGERPKEADRVLAPLRRALEKQGFIAAPAEVTKVLRSYRTLPAVTEPNVTTRELTEAFERAHGDWLDGRLDRAATRLEAAVAVAHRVPNLLAAEQKTRDLLFSALLSLSQARNRQRQQAKSEAAMAELIRSFPDQLITRGEHGPEAYELYRAARRGLDAEGRGALIVKVNVPSVVFLDEVPRSQDVNGAQIADLVSGEYRLLIQSANEPTSFRYYKIPIYAHQISRLEIHWELDSVLVTGDWVGFRFDTSLRQAKEVDAALRVARDTSTHTVVTLRVEVGKQSKLVEANLYELTRRKKICAGRIRLTGHATDAVYISGLANTLGSCLGTSEDRGAVREDTKRLSGADTPPSSASAPPSKRTESSSKGTPSTSELPWVPDDPPSLGKTEAPAAARKASPRRTGR
jgi:hypothetical protein